MKKSILNILIGVAISLSTFAAVALGEGGPLPTFQQVDKISKGDYATLCEYIGEKNKVIMISVYKTEFKALAQYKNKIASLTYYARVVQSNLPDFPVGQLIRWGEIIELPFKLDCFSSKLNPKGELYYIFGPCLLYHDKVNNEKLIDWHIEYHVKMTNAGRYSTLRASLTIPPKK